MVSNRIQPLSSIGPIRAEKEDKKIDNPARRDYIKGRELYTAGNYSEAIVAFHNSLKGFEEQGDDQGVANSADRLGDACMIREEYEMALENYERAYAICQKEGDSFSLLSLNKKRAVILRKMGRFDEAMVLLFDMFDHYHMTNNPEGSVGVLMIMAEVYIAKGNIDKAVDAYRTVASIHNNFKHKRRFEEFSRLADELEQE